MSEPLAVMPSGSTETGPGPALTSVWSTCSPAVVPPAVAVGRAICDGMP